MTKSTAAADPPTTPNGATSGRTSEVGESATAVGKSANPSEAADGTVIAAQSDDAVDADRRAPGRPRSTRADKAIIEATLDLLAEGTTLEAMSIEAIAARAGVSRTTLYRRWTNKEMLIDDALGALKGPLPELDGLSIRDDLVKLLESIAAMRTARIGRVIPCLIPELPHNPKLARRFHALGEPRRELMRSVLHRGIESGELRADIDIEMTCAMLSGPMVSQTWFDWHPDLDMTNMSEKVVDGILPGLRG